MKLNSGFAGTNLKDFKAKVTWRDTTNYAASIDDYNPLYFDDTAKEGIFAPPMYTAALAWKILGNIANYIEQDTIPPDIIATQVHYTEYMEFHRLIKAGDELLIKGQLTAILPHRAGTQIVIKFEAYDINNKLVYTEFISGLMRGVICNGNGKGEENIPIVPQSTSDQYEWHSSIHIDKTRPYVYDGCTDIVFPIHTSPDFAKKVGLPGIILQGTATLAYAIREIINKEAKGDPGKIKRLYCRFTGMVFPDTDITVRKIDSSQESKPKNIFFDVLNNQGQKALSRGFVELR